MGSGNGENGGSSESQDDDRSESRDEDRSEDSGDGVANGLSPWNSRDDEDGGDIQAMNEDVLV